MSPYPGCRRVATGNRHRAEFSAVHSVYTLPYVRLSTSNPPGKGRLLFDRTASHCLPSSLAAHHASREGRHKKRRQNRGTRHCNALSSCRPPRYTGDVAYYVRKGVVCIPLATDTIPSTQWSGSPQKSTNLFCLGLRRVCALRGERHRDVFIMLSVARGFSS